MKRLHTIAAVCAGLGLTAGFVGYLDRFTAGAAIGAPMSIIGTCVFVIAVITLYFTSRTEPLSSAMVLLGGTIPVAAFAFFLVWRIGLSIEQQNLCDDGEALSCKQLGERRFKRNKVEEARALLTRGCELGDGESCLLASGAYPEESAEYEDALRRGCDLNEALACYRVALEFEPNDSQTYRDLVEHSCSLGYRAACADVQAEANEAPSADTD